MRDFDGKAQFAATPAVLGTMCADELDCAYEGATLCAFDVGGDAAAESSGTGTTQASFDFLECFDNAGSLPLFYDPSHVQACADQQKLDYGAISKCANGTASAKLLKAAQKTVTAACGKEAVLPTVHVAGKKVCESDKCTYSTIADAIASAASASAIMASSPSLRGGGVNATVARGSEPTITYFFASQ